jgi:hypothetical protein
MYIFTQWDIGFQIGRQNALAFIFYLSKNIVLNPDLGKQ